MKIYIEIIIILNIYLDFLILLSVNIILVRNAKIKKILLGSLIGSITTIFLLIKINNILLTVIKLTIGIIMCITTFSYKNIKYTLNNILYLYTTSIILGGGLYLIKQYKYNYIILIIASIMIIYLNIKINKKNQNNYQNYYKVTIKYQDKIYELTGYLDTGNKLIYNISKKPVIIIQKNIKIEKIIYVPFKALNTTSILKCFEPEYIKIDNKTFNNYLVGISKDKIQIDGVDCILNSSMKGQI